MAYNKFKNKIVGLIPFRFFGEGSDNFLSKNDSCENIVVQLVRLIHLEISGGMDFDFVAVEFGVNLDAINENGVNYIKIPPI